MPQPNKNNDEKIRYVETDEKVDYGKGPTEDNPRIVSMTKEQSPPPKGGSGAKPKPTPKPK